MIRDAQKPPSKCLRKALLAAPGYIDAMFNLALLLQRKARLPKPPSIGGVI
jgi:hypothetical protein